MSHNQHGLDADYFKKKLGLLVRDADHMTPQEMHTALSQLAETARPPRQHAERGEPVGWSDFVKKVAALAGMLPSQEMAHIASCLHKMARGMKFHNTPPAPAISLDGDEDYQREFRDFWAPILLKDGVLDVEQMKKELADFSLLIGNVSKVYDHVTGNAISKPLTDPDVVCRVADDHFNEQLRESLAEEREDAPAPVVVLPENSVGYKDQAEVFDYQDRGWNNCLDEVRRLNATTITAAELEGLRNRATFQQRVQPWLMECFGTVIAADTVERNHRFLEEALELVQASGATADEAHKLVEYVYGRPVGELGQEVGGVMVTLAALCLANGVNMHDCAEVELARILQPEIVIKIREKQSRKPSFSPLPGVYPERQPAAISGQDALAGGE